MQMLRSAVVAAVMMLAGVTATSAATVRALALPAGYTIAPEAAMPAVGIDGFGTVVAVARARDGRRPPLALRWTPDGTRTTFVPLPARRLSQHPIPDEIEHVAIGFSGETYVTTGVALPDMGGLPYEVQQWTAAGTAASWTSAACAVPSNEPDEHVAAVAEDGRVALTRDITGPGSSGVLPDNVGALAPYALIVDGPTCTVLGRATIAALRGRYAAGYRGYLAGHLAPDNLNPDVQRYVAVRWTGDALHELGLGVALAVNADGLVVGASGPPDHADWEHRTMAGAYVQPMPQALAWNAKGQRIVIVGHALRSVAYDVADDGTVVGTLRERDGTYHAFRWRDGHGDLLDDLPHSPDWRFTSAYAITPDGTIAGVGTYRGVPAVFVWHA
jgi:probable HAF family extracellular repeat protein